MKTLGFFVVGLVLGWVAMVGLWVGGFASVFDVLWGTVCGLVGFAAGVIASYVNPRATNTVHA